ncbi:MAG: hypothetical protein Q8R37_01800, partial [Nanoarchaeota archaeon]|nr:hypothetical protein [Nanoarchaeota archaeon]
FKNRKQFLCIMPGYIPTQSLVFLVTNSEGHIPYDGIDVPPETIYATFLDRGRRFLFEHKDARGLKVKPVQELTDKILEEMWYDSHKQIEIRRKGLVQRTGFLLGGIPFYQNMKTDEVGGVFWIPEESLGILDKKGLQYKVLKTVEGHWPKHNYP